MIHVVEELQHGERLDRVIAEATGRSRREAKDLVVEGRVSVDGRTPTKASQPAVLGTTLSIDLPDPPASPVMADAEVRFDVIHEDEAIVVVDKPAGLVVHPGAGRTGGTLADGLLARYPQIEGVGPEHRPGIVHRLDRGTSGLLVVARTEAVRERLVGALAAREIERSYAALVWGRVGSARGVVDAPIGRSRRDPTKRAVVEDGRLARTHYAVEDRFDDPEEATLLECRLETGRTHQIRVHLAAIDHPVVADRPYGGALVDVGLERPFLHARRLAFAHPTTAKTMTFTAPLPADLEATLARFRAGRGRRLGHPVQ